MRASGKYVQIADDLTRRIMAREYCDILPPLRTLTEEYNASLGTIQKALELLSVRNLVMADSTRGIRVIHRPNSNVVGIFCNFRKGSSSDILVRSLRQRIEDDDCEAIFVDVPDKVCRDINGAFWRYGWAEGYISLYGTSDLAIDRCLQSFNLPVVTANRARRPQPIPCVDFDHRKLLRMLAEGLFERGYRRIALSFTICSQLICDEVLAEFADFRNAHGLPEIPAWVTSGCEADVVLPREARIAGQFEQIFSTAVPPDAVICFHRGLKFAKALAMGMGRKIGSDLVLTGTGDGDFPEQGIMPVTFSYEKLAQSLWDALKKRWHGGDSAGINARQQIESPDELTLLMPETINWSVVPFRMQSDGIE